MNQPRPVTQPTLTAKNTALARLCSNLYIRLLLLQSFQHEVVYPDFVIRHSRNIIELESKVLRREVKRQIIHQEIQRLPDHHNRYELTRASVAEIIAAAALRDKIERCLLPAIKPLGHKRFRVHPFIRVPISPVQIQ